LPLVTEFAPGFRGKFDSFTISAAADQMRASDSPLAKEDTERIRALIEPLLSLASGGENAGLIANSGRAIRLSTAALSKLATLRFGGPAATSSRPLVSSASLLDLLA
jgi:hypothetical protein